MAFGKRSSEQPGMTSTPPRADRPVISWQAYPSAILAVAVVSYLTMNAMALIPAFNPSRTPIGTIAVLALIAALNITIVAGIIMALVDLVLSLVRYRRQWLYCAAVGGLAYAFCLWVGSLGDVVPNPVLYIGMALIPAAIGGWVLGHFRRG